jgi:Tfp pilus assembly protein PilN
VSQVNLLPPEIRQRAQARRTALLVIGAGVVVLVLIGFFYVVQSANLSRVNEDIAAQERKNAAIRSEIQGLQEFAALQSEAQAKQALLTTAFANEVSFSGILLDLSRVIPSDAYLTTFSAQVAPPAAETPGAVAATPGTVATDTPLIGTMTAAGEASGTDSLASWITRLESVKGWVNPWISTFTESTPSSDRFIFNSGTDLTSEVLTDRARDAGEAVAP